MIERRTPLKRTPIRKRRTKPRRGRVISKPYKAWIASLPCVVCGTRKDVEVAHVGARGMSQKCSDFETLPLCVAHHREGPEAHHVLGKKFWDHHQLDRDKLIQEHNELWNRMNKLAA